MTDIEIIALLRSSPQKGLAAVFDRYSAYVYKIVYTKLGDICTNEDIEEAVSDIFFKFYQSVQKDNREIHSLRGYLSLIAERHCIDVFRSRTNDIEPISYDEISDTISSPDRQPDTELYDALKALGEPDTTIFIRKYFFGQKSSDIALEMNLKPNTVDKRISRGLIKLRKILKEEK